MKSHKMNLCQFAIFLVAGFFTQTAMAQTTIYYLTPSSNVQAAVNTASSGDTLVFTNGTGGSYTAQVVTINKDLTLIGGSGSRPVISAMGAASVFVISSGVEVSMEYLEIEDADGQAGVVNNGTLTLDDCWVRDNIGLFGGIANLGGDLTLIDCDIFSNRSPSLGGGVTNAGGQVDASGNHIHLNVGYLGGGLHNSFGTANLTSNLFYNNHANSLGGGYSNHNIGGVVNSSGDSFTGNSATSCPMLYDVNLSPSCQ